MPPKKTRPTLHVLFDSNSILADGFEHIVSEKAADAIRAHSRHGDLNVVWLLPEVVSMEREYQMRNAFRHVLKPTQQAERLLGENWDVSQARIHAAIESRIQAQLTDLGLRVMPCDPGRVDWPALTRRSAFRLAPFQHGETEKGFRDAILCETFYQLVDSLSGKATAVLVSKDGLVGTAVNERISGARIVADIEALCDEINLRVSNVDASTATQLEAMASMLLFDFDQPDAPSLLRRHKVPERIWEQFGDQIKAPAKDLNWQMETPTLSHSRLVKKEGSRVFFATTYTVESYVMVWVPGPSPAPVQAITLDPPSGIGSQVTALPPGLLSGSYADIARTYYGRDAPGVPLSTLIGSASSGQFERRTFDPVEVQIQWSATYSRQKRLTHARIDNLVLVRPPSAQTKI